MEVLSRSRSQTAGVTTFLKYFVKQEDRAFLLDVDDIRKRNGHLLNPRPELFSNLGSFVSGCSAKFQKILNLYGAGGSEYVITDIGFSHLINYCIKYDLPDDNEVIKALCFVIFQIFKPKEIKRGGVWALFDRFVKYMKGNEQLIKNSVKGLNVNNHAVIRVEFATLTYIVKYQGCVDVKKEVEVKCLQRLIGDQIGSFKGIDSKLYDAVSFMSIKIKINSTLVYNNIVVDVGYGFYKQLLAEVNVLI